MCATGLNFTENVLAHFTPRKSCSSSSKKKKKRSGELKHSEFLAMADGGKRDELMEKSLPRCLFFSVKRKRKQMHMEGGGGGGKEEEV